MFMQIITFPWSVRKHFKDFELVVSLNTWMIKRNWFLSEIRLSCIYLYFSSTQKSMKGTQVYLGELCWQMTPNLKNKNKN